MTGIHDVFPLDAKGEDDPISLKKILKKEGAWAVVEDVLGFEFDGHPGEHTIYLTEQHQDDILSVLKRCIREGKDSAKGIPFDEFSRYTSKLRNAFISILAGKFLLSYRAINCWSRSRQRCT